MAAAGWCLQFYVLIFYSIIAVINASINIDELNSVNYAVDILGKPVLSGQEMLGSGLMMQVMSKYGQQYQCILPEVVPPLSTSSESQNKQEDGSLTASKLNSPANIVELLKPIEAGPCLMKTKDWWTYEFCYGKYIKQFHLEDGKVSQPVIVLGLYESEYDWNNESNTEDSNRNRLNRYHSQYYVNGTSCDVTGNPRRAEVRFVCEEGAGDYIAQVEEPESCRYLVRIHTMRICHHPYLKPPPTNKPKAIVCNPVLNAQQYEAYLRKKETERKMAEDRRRVWLEQQEQRLNKLKLEKQSAEGASVEAAEEAADDIKADTTDETSSQELESLDDSDDEGSTFSEMLNSLNQDIDDDEVLDKITFGKLASTLNKLMKQLDKSEKDLNTANEGLEKHKKSDKQDSEIDTDDNEVVDKSEEVVTQKSEMEMESPLEEEVTGEGDDYQEFPALGGGNDQVRVRINRITSSKLKSLQDQKGDTDSQDKQELEKTLLTKLEKSGLDTSGKKIEVKIITAGYLDDDEKEFHILSNEESSQFQALVLKLLAGNRDLIENLEKQKTMEDSYKFVWEQKTKSPLDDDEE